MTGDDLLEEESPQDAPLPSNDADAREDAAAVAAEAVTAWAQPDLAFDEWWAGLSPYLSWSATQAFADVDPANVPANEVTGPATVVDDSSPFLITVRVPTDGGELDVLLSRQTQADPWLVETILPAAS